MIFLKTNRIGPDWTGLADLVNDPDLKSEIIQSDLWQWEVKQ